MGFTWKDIAKHTKHPFDAFYLGKQGMDNPEGKRVLVSRAYIKPTDPFNAAHYARLIDAQVERAEHVDVLGNEWSGYSAHVTDVEHWTEHKNFSLLISGGPLTKEEFEARKF